eukprot:Phypoly_transcript_18823.p1 GENE.Phypoly_transcript_18823~~Phypoly_transcript_18823.p1  ORF type:complete len:208 (-),score=42.98 Phypoly_transcript_18823:45-668(-)
MMLQAVLPSSPTTSPPVLRSSTPPALPDTSPRPSASLSLHEDDKLMQDPSPPLVHQTHPTSPPVTPTKHKHSTSTKDPDDLAESVMNWDLGGESSRGTKRKTAVQEPEPEVKELVVKLQKLTHDIHKVDGVRIIHVKFAPGVILKAKKLFQEPWGTMVSALEDYQSLDIKVGQKFWTRWDGETTPYTSLPIYHAVHSVADRKQFFTM